MAHKRGTTFAKGVIQSYLCWISKVAARASPRSHAMTVSNKRKVVTIDGLPTWKVATRFMQIARKIHVFVKPLLSLSLTAQVINI